MEVNYQGKTYNLSRNKYKKIQTQMLVKEIYT